MQAADFQKDNFSPDYDFRWWKSYECPTCPNATHPTNATGTSLSAPMVAGYAAYAMRAVKAELPTCGGQPQYWGIGAQQVTRAIVMASARHNPKTWFYDDTGTWTQQRTRLNTGDADAKANERKQRDGTGVIDMFGLVKLLQAGSPCNRWWSHTPVTIGSTPPSDPIVKGPWSWPEPDSGLGRARAVIAWNPDDQGCNDSGTCDPGTIHQGYDLDFCVYEVVPGGNDIVVGCADSWENNYEAADFYVKTDGTQYIAKINVFSGLPNTKVHIGAAVYFDAFHPGIP